MSVEGTNLVTYTNQYGDYVLPNVPAGPVQLRASYTGLDEESATVNVTAGSATTHNFELTSRARYGEDKALVLDAFVVESQREYEGDALATNEQRHAPNIKVVMSSDSFGTINEGNPGEFLKYLPGITVDYVAADVRTVSVRGVSAQITNGYWVGFSMTRAAAGSTVKPPAVSTRSFSVMPSASGYVPGFFTNPSMFTKRAFRSSERL